MTLTSQEYKFNDTYVSINYKDGEPVDVTVQEKDGEILFNGSFKDMTRVLSIFNELKLGI